MLKRCRSIGCNGTAKHCQDFCSSCGNPAQPGHYKCGNVCVQTATQALLRSDVCSGDKAAFDIITKARDTLTRWLHLNQGTQ